MKVKEFKGKYLEEELNTWIEENKSEYVVLDIKYSVANEWVKCALVLYESKPKYMF